MKNSFKVGDKIRGLKNNKYNITNEEMELAEVIKIYKDRDDMKIKILKLKLMNLYLVWKQIKRN